MKHGKQVGTHSLKHLSGAARYRHRDALARTALALAIGMGLPRVALAQTHVQPSVHDGHKPTVIKAANGTPVVNIVAPDKHGLSHNVYGQFDVGSNGLILNNSAAITKTQLAGYVYGNANLKAGGSASIILNEVVSTRPSQLNGYMEVAGTPAEVIVANPNGIACDGCGFINTPRAVLTTGKPILGSDGRLTGFRVTQGAINIRGAGMDASGIDRVDLLARAVKLNGKLWAQHLNVITGANRIDAADLSTQAVAGTDARPELSLDVAALGGMYAGVIHLVGTENGVGVNSQGEIAAQAGDFILTSAGDIVLDGKATATGKMTITTGQAIDAGGVLAAGGTLALQGDALNLAGSIYSDKDIHLAAEDAIRNDGQVQAHGGQLVVQADGETTNTAKGVFYASGQINIDAAALTNAGDMEAGQVLGVQTTGVTLNAGVMQADGGALSLRAQTLNNAGTLGAAGDVSVTALGNLSTTGQLIASRDITLAAGTLTTAGVVQAGHGLTVTAHDLTNSGKLYALGGSWKANIADAVVNTVDGDIYAADDLTLDAVSLAQHGLLEASQILTVATGGVLTNDGVMQSDAATLTLDGDIIRNAGTLSAAGNMVLHADTTLSNTTDMVAGGNITLAGHDIVTGSSIKAGQALHLTSQGDISITGKLYALGGSLDLDVAGKLTNQSTGDVYGKQAVAIRAGQMTNIGAVASSGDVQATVGFLDNQGRLQSDGQLVLESAADIANAGILYADQNFNLSATSLHNGGTLRSGAGLDINVQGDVWNLGSVYALGNARWQVDGRLSNSGVLASAANTDVAADALQGAGTLAAGLGGDGKLGASGDLVVHVVHGLQAGGRNLAAGHIDVSGSAVDLSGSQTFANDDIRLNASAGDITLRGAQLTAGKTAAFTASGALVNGGTTIADGGRISADILILGVASINNRYGHLVQSGDGDLAIHLNGVFDNAHGLLATNAGKLSITAALIGNAHGNIQHAGNGLLTLQSAGAVDNEDGVIASNGGLTVTLGGAFDNADGQVGIFGDAALHAASLDNSGGAIAAADLLLALSGNVDNGAGTLQSTAAFNLHADALTNGADGQIKVAGNDALDVMLSGSLVNATDAFIGGNGHVTVQVAQMTNAGQIYAGSDLDVATTDGALDNQGGTLQAMGSLTASSAAALDNASGRIEAGAGQSIATLHINADSLDNHGGRLANAGAGATVVAIEHGIDNRGGTLGGQSDVRLAAASMDNTHAGKLIAGRDFILQLARLANADGTVYAARNLVWNRPGASLTNVGGDVGAGGDLSLTLGAVDNAGGNLDAGHDVSLGFTTLTGGGRAAAGHDLSITLSGDYTNGSGSVLKANHDLAITIGGHFVNPEDAVLEAVNGLTIRAASIDNADGAFINSADTSLIATHGLTNEGRIEGDTVSLRAASIANTGSVMGSRITAHAGSLVNGADLGKATYNTAYQSALIAATDSLDLYVTGTLLNRDATLFTLGDMTLAADAAGQRSHAIINRSGDIEAGGNVVIAAEQITNERRYIHFQTFAVSGNTIEGWTGGGSAGTLARGTPHGLRMMLRPPIDPGDPGGGGGSGQPPNQRTQSKTLPLDEAGTVMNQLCAGGLPDGWRCKPGAMVEQTDTWIVTSATVLTAVSAESRILAGKDISLDGSLRNDASTVSAGNDLVINGVRESGEIADGTIGGESVRNIAYAPTVGVSHDRTQSIREQKKERCGGYTKHCWNDKGLATLTFHDNQLPADGDMSFVTLDLGPTLSAHITAGNTVDIRAHDIDNTVVDADGHPVHGAIALGANGGGHSVDGGPVRGAGTVDAGHGTVGGVSLGQAPGAASGHGDVSTAPPQTVPSLTGPDVHIPLPQSGLYTINTDPDGSYLIETDPRFADYAKFISSDYLLGMLGYDPATIGKRLGDGFYEERQVLDQITELTGRRYLSNDTDALAQYRALMDNASVAADKFDFQVGVALTAEQMAALTQDIVWLVNATVDGQSVLVPVVYLSQAHANQLGQAGAVIAGRNVILDASGDIANNGSILASQSASLKAGNLLNSGTLAAGGDLSIQTAQDILNQGGIVRGADVSLIAGGDVASSAGVGPVNLGGIDLGDVATGSITATGNLNVLAGRNIALSRASVSAGDNMNLAAGRDLIATATTVHAGKSLTALAGRDISLNATAERKTSYDGHTFTATTTHQVSQLSAGQQVTVVAGRDVTSQGATLKAGDTLNVAAGRDINLGTVTDNQYTQTQWKKGHTTGTTTTSDDTLRGTTLDGAKGVSLVAGRDATLVAATIDGGKGNVALSAGHDLNLAAGEENHTRVEDTRTHHSSLLSSSTTTTHDVTDDTLAIGTRVKGQNVQFLAGHDLTTEGAQVQAAKALALAAGHDVKLGAADSAYRSQHHQHKTKTHFGMDLITGVGDGQLYTKTNDDQQGMQVDHIATGTLLSGDIVNVTAGHDLTTEGAQVAATHDLVMTAGHDLVIGAAANTHDEKQQHKHRVDGWQRSGLVGMVGTTKTRQRANAGEVSYTGSLIGSNQGQVSLMAGNNAHITGSDVISQTGIAIVGKNVTIDAALGSTDSHQEYSMHRAGITGGLGGPVGNLVNSAYGAYSSAKRGGQVKDKRLKALYAAKAAYQAYDTYKAVDAYAGTGEQNGMGGTGVSLKIALGASTANSHANTHDDIAYGSHIRSQGDIAIAATDGDLHVVGSQIKGDNVALSASHDLNLLSQAEQHTQKQSGAHAGGQIGVSIGQTTGIFLSVNGGKARAHGNGTTHAITTVDADGTLSLTAGHDALLRGAQAKGDTLLADIGHNLTLESEQDTGDFASQQWEAGLTLVYGYSDGGVGVSGHASAGAMNNHYKSVTQVTGLAAGDDGFRIHVGGNTDLNGAVIASTANPSKNLLDTGSLTYSDIQNEAKYSSWSVSVGASTGDQFGITPQKGVAGGLGIPQSGDQSSTTRAGIAQGTIITRNGHTDLSGLDRDPNIDAQGLTRKFDRQKLAEQQEMGQVAGYVGMRSAGWLADKEQKKAAADYADAYRRGDTAAMETAKARMQQWGDGGTYKTILHGMVGAATAALGGGSTLDGALGATASEAASGAMEQYLVDHHVDPTSATGKSLMELASTTVGAVAGQGAGAATALQGEKYNRQLHDDEKARIKALAHGDPMVEAKLAAAACYLVHCAAQYPKDSAVHAYFSQLEAAGSQLTSEQALLQQQSDTHYIYLPSLMRFGPQVAKREVTTQLFEYSKGDAFSDNAKRLNSTYSLTTRGGGLLQAVGGAASMVTGGAGFVVGGAACPESLGASCAVAAGGVGLAVWGADQTQAGWNTLWTGVPTRTFGGEVIQNVLGVSPQAAELLYGLPGLVDGASIGLLARSKSTGELIEIGIDGSLTLTGKLPPSGLNARQVLPNGIAVDMEAGGWSQYDVFKKVASRSDQNDQWGWNWPNDGGAVAGTEETIMLEKGGLVDRFGSPEGGYLAPAGTPISSRSLAPGSTTEYHQYIVLKSFEVTKSEAASAFGEGGGGIQYEIPELPDKPVTVKQLIEYGYLRRLK